MATSLQFKYDVGINYYYMLGVSLFLAPFKCLLTDTDRGDMRPTLEIIPNANLPRNWHVCVSIYLT